jgi:hypothetical protein
MSEEKGVRGAEPEEVRSLKNDEGEEVEGHVRSLGPSEEKGRTEDEDSDEPDVEGHVRAT